MFTINNYRFIINMKLENYPTGSIITINDRKFQKENYGTIWLEILTKQLYSSFSLRCLELTTNELHQDIVLGNM